MLNVKAALRALVKTPFVTLVAIASLALGIGANAAIFSLFNQILLRPLAVADPGRLVNLRAPGPKQGANSCNQAGDCESIFSYPMFRDLERVQTVFTGVAAHRLFAANILAGGQTSSGEGMLVSGSYFQVLGLAPALGRLPGPRDDGVPGEPHIVVLSHAYWQQRFAGDPNVVNQTMIVNGQTMTIAGVAPRGFSGTTLGGAPPVFVPITMRWLMEPMLPNSGLDNRRSYWVYLFARLKPGVTIEQAQAALAPQYTSILNDVEAPLQQGMSAQTLARFKAKPLTLEAGPAGQSDMPTQAKTPLTLLLGVTGLVLIIAAANIANLLLTRGAARAPEMALRLSLGASRWQLVTQLLTESLLLAALGGAAGLLVAKWTLAGIAAMLPAEGIGPLTFGLDPSMLLFAVALTVGTGFLFGLFPAWNSTRPDLLSALKSQAAQSSGSRAASRFRTSLATAQVALSLALLASAGLFTRSLLNVGRVDLGLRPENVLTFQLSPELSGYKPVASQTFFDRLEGELRPLPGVNSVSASVMTILAGNNWGRNVSVEGITAGPDTDMGSNYNGIGPGLFRTLGIPLLAGRDFTESDAAGAAKVAIVNEAFAKKFNLGSGAVGKRMASGRSATLDIEIVGLVKDSKYSDVKRDVPPVFYTPYRQETQIGRLTFYVRTDLAPEQLAPAVRATIARLDPSLPIDRLTTLPQQIRENVFLDRVVTTLSAAFAIVATLLAVIGLYGVLAYTVAQRTREIGLRIALGAAPARVQRMILKQVGWMVLVGGAIGLTAAIGLGRTAQSLLFGLEGTDPLILAGSLVTLGVIALAAGFVPARRASKIDPMLALRCDG